jgi:SAM-dependent methyltransferase
MAKFRYRSFRRPFDPRWRFMAGFQDPKRILDLGCGEGGNCVTFRGLYPHAEIYGVDILEQGPASIHYQQVDLDRGDLPFDDEFFDIITLTHVIEHLRHPLRLGSEIYRVLRPDGGLYLEAPNWTTILVPSWGFCRAQSGGFNFYDDPTHIKPWSKHGLFEFMREHCCLRVETVGTRRNWARLPLDILKLPVALVQNQRHSLIEAFWNVYGWSIFGIGLKDKAVQSPRNS